MSGRKQPVRLTEEQSAALDALQAMADTRLWVSGGYPAVVDGCTVRGHVIVADVDDAYEPSLAVYRWRDVLRWCRDALRFLEENPDFADDEDGDGEAVPGIGSAMYETEPHDIDLCRGEA